MPESAADRWSTLLDELEREAATGAAGSAAWRPPAGLGPMPARFRTRAEALASAQQAAIAELERQKGSAARHLAALQTLPQHRDETGPVYLDASG